MGWKLGSKTMKNVLILGGAGFLGSHLAERLSKTPGVHSIWIFDHSAFPWTRVDDVPSTYLVRGSISTESEKLLAAMRNCDTVFHLAANADIAKAATDPTVDFWQGTHLTQCVLEAMRQTGVKRLFYTSGSGVYGDLGETPVREDMPCQPVSPYGASKLASEAMISAYSHMFGIKASVFRFANVVGPRQTHGVAYDFIRKLRADPTKLEIMGDGTQSKSYVHVDDILDAIFLVAEKQAKTYDTWNVAGDDYVMVSEIADMACEVMGGIKPERIFGSERRGWKGDVPVARFDCSKIRALGWRPFWTSHGAMDEAMRAMLKE